MQITGISSTVLVRVEGNNKVGSRVDLPAGPLTSCIERPSMNRRQKAAPWAIAVGGSPSSAETFANVMDSDISSHPASNVLMPTGIASVCMRAGEGQRDRKEHQLVKHGRVV